MAPTTRPPTVPVGGDAALSDWFRHYAALLLLLTVLGTVGGAAWGTFTTPRAEMWSIVVDTEQLLPARQLGVVAETLFRAEETYRSAIAELREDWSPQELFDHVELRSVPESRLLIVVATADDTFTAAIVSDAMARSLSEAFEVAGYPGFETLGAPQPPAARSTVSLPVFAALGASVGLLFGAGVAIVHFRTRRPVLTIGTAEGLVGLDDVVSVPHRWRALGVLRHWLPTSLSASARGLATGRLHGDGSTVMVRWAGASPRRAARMGEILGLDVDPGGARTVVVAEPNSRSRDLSEDPTARRDPGATLLWLA